MEPDVKRRMTPDILGEVAERYGVAADDLVARNGFESFIYETNIGGERAILRIGHGERRPSRLVHAELHWMGFLASRGIGVPRPLRSANGHLVEPVDDGHGSEFVAAAFSYAPGRPPTEADWAPPLWERYGRLLGAMHAATLDYQPPPGAMRRPHWDDKAMIDVFDHLPSNEPQARSAFDGAMAHLTALPRGKAEYGLIHQDAHGGNFFVTDEGAITLFDFDDCCYSWFANDIAIVIFYAMSWTNFENQDPYAERFWNHFIRGYSAEHAISDEWLAEIPWFLKLREIDTYAIIHRSMDVNNIADPWARRFMAGRRERINEGIPYLEMDFAHPRPGTP